LALHSRLAPSFGQAGATIYASLWRVALPGGGEPALKKAAHAMSSRGIFIGTTLAENPVPHHFVVLAKALVSRGHRVVLLAPHRRLDLERPMGNPAIFTWPSDRPTKSRDASFLYWLIRRYRPDCLIANFGAVNLMNVVGKLMRVPCRAAWYHTVRLAPGLSGAKTKVPRLL
jgi:hypothetical protein